MQADNLTGKSDSHITWLRKGIGIHTAIAEPWHTMCQAAKADSIDLEIVSGFRNFDRQLNIWNAKFLGNRPVKDLSNNTLNLTNVSAQQKIEAIMLYSALPGASRHHWGTDIDVYSPSMLAKNRELQLEPWEYDATGPFAQLYDWLENNARQFGFYFPYSEYRGGVAPEPWHLSFFPLADIYTKSLSIDAISDAISNSDIEGKSDILTMLPSLYNKFITNIKMS